MTPEETHELLVELGVLQHGHFRLTSGSHSDTYLQCARALQYPDAGRRIGAALAELVAGLRCDVVASPAIGGILAGYVVATALERRFVFAERSEGAMAFRRGQGPSPGERVLVVEDVVTTGASALEVAHRSEEVGADVVGLACIVDRSPALPADARPPLEPQGLLTVAPVVWEPDTCPLCAEGRPLDRPGSRSA